MNETCQGNAGKNVMAIEIAGEGENRVCRDESKWRR